MTYETLLADAIHYSPAQEAAGPLVDAIGNANWTPGGAPTYQQPGPTPWLPNSLNLSGATNDQLSFVIPADLLGVRDFTFALWLRRTTAGGPAQRIIDDALNVYLLLTPPALQLQMGGIVTDGNVADQQWHLCSFGCQTAGVAAFSQVDLARTGPVGTLFPGFVASTMIMGSAGGRLNADVAGLVWWPRLLTTDEIETWSLGPTAASNQRARRGSGKVRRVGRR